MSRFELSGDFLPVRSIPLENAQFRWGLSYPSQKQSYRSGGFLFELLGSWGESETALARKRRRGASQQPYAERREILRLASRRGCDVPYGERGGW